MKLTARIPAKSPKAVLELVISFVPLDRNAVDTDAVGADALGVPAVIHDNIAARANSDELQAQNPRSSTPLVVTEPLLVMRIELLAPLV